MASHSDSSHSIRLCHPEDHNIFFHLDSEQTGKFGGVFGHLTDEIIAMIRRINNGTMAISRNQGFGDPTDEPGMFTGCIGRLQRNQSDILFYPSDYPFEAKHIEQGLIMYDVKFVITQTHLTQKILDEQLEILATLHIYGGIWHLMVTFILLVTGVICTRRWLLSLDKRPRYILSPSTGKKMRVKQNKRDLTRVIAHAYRLGTVDDDTLFDKIIFFSLSIFALYVVHYYSSLIKTSLVVVGKPNLWKSYEDMMMKRTPPYFIKGFNAQWYFINAKKGSRKEKFWNWVKGNFNLSDVIIPGNPATFSDYGLRMVQGQTVLISDNIMARTVALAACGFHTRDRTVIANHAEILLSSPDSIGPEQFAKNGYREKIINKLTNFIIRQIVDPGEGKLIKGLMFSEYFTGRNALEFKRRTRFFNEFGLTVQTMKIVETTDIFKSLAKDIGMKEDVSKLSEVDECMGSEESHDEIEVESIDLTRFKQLSIAMSAIFGVSSFLLIFEWIRSFFGSFFP